MWHLGQGGSGSCSVFVFSGIIGLGVAHAPVVLLPVRCHSPARKSSRLLVFTITGWRSVSAESREVRRLGQVSCKQPRLKTDPRAGIGWSGSLIFCALQSPAQRACMQVRSRLSVLQPGWQGLLAVVSMRLQTAKATYQGGSSSEDTQLVSSGLQAAASRRRRDHETPMRRRLGVYRHGDAAAGFPDAKSVGGKQIIKHPPAIRCPSNARNAHGLFGSRGVDQTR